MTTYAEAYEMTKERAKKRDQLASTIADYMEETAKSITIDDASAIEFHDGSVYLIEDDCSFDDADEAECYIIRARAEAEADMRDANATADYMLGRTGK